MKVIFIWLLIGTGSNKAVVGVLFLKQNLQRREEGECFAMC